MDALPAPATIFSGLETCSNALRSLDKLRRLCGKLLEEEKGGNKLRNIAKLVLERIVDSIEIAGKQVILHTPGSFLVKPLTYTVYQCSSQ
jgi:hypothetical protein